VNVRLLPWAACVAVVLALAVRAALPGKGEGMPAPRAVEGPLNAGPDIRLGPAEVREFHEDGSWNRLEADAAVYEYARRILTGRGVVVYPMGGPLRGATMRAPSASWDFDRAVVSFPEGGSVAREGGWTGELSPAVLDIAGRVLRVPGAATLSGPGFSVHGMNLVWSWTEGTITMDSPRSRLKTSPPPRRKG
jgi:hypothetical protein